MDHSAPLSTSPIRRLRRRAEVLTVGIITAFILCFSVWCLVGCPTENTFGSII